jgi:membrane protein
VRVLSEPWKLLRETILSFVEDEALNHDRRRSSAGHGRPAPATPIVQRPQVRWQKRSSPRQMRRERAPLATLLNSTITLLGDLSAAMPPQKAFGGAAIAFYTVTSIAPVRLIVIAIAGLAFGEDAAENAIVAQLSDLMGPKTAEVLQSAVASAASKSSGTIATIIGVITLMVAASGVFAEMQSTLNAIWKAELKGLTLSRLIRARAASLGLVAALGLLLIVSLAVSAALTAFGNYLDSILPFTEFVFPAMHFIVSLLLISVLFTVIYKVLPDRHLEWRDVVVGGVVTAVLFNIEKSLIGWYIGSSAVASSYGAAGASIVLLLLDLLLNSTVLARSGIHQSLCRPPWQ